MISTEEATRLILERAPAGWGTEVVRLENALGRVLAEDLRADREFPPFDRVTMDGVAIAYAAWQEGKREFRIAGMAPAGAPEETLSDNGSCLEVMTGALLPRNTDTVIRYEDLELRGGIAQIREIDIRQGQNIHRKGSDRPVESLLLASGTPIGPAEIGVAATVGKPELRVQKWPRLTLISTGNEIVPIDQQPAPYQIRTSNIPTLQALFRQWGLPAGHVHLPDDLDATRHALEGLVAENDLIILSGGVSKGKFDYVPKALAEIGVEKVFHRIRQRPGKPLWFGQKEAGPTVFALPGNPVSTFVCCLRYVQPWLRKGLGLEPYTYGYAALAAPFEFQPELTYFLQVRVEMGAQGNLWAHPKVGRGSGDHANLADVNGFLELPADRTTFPEGEIFPLLAFRDIF